MGFKLVRFLEATGYNRKLFFMDGGEEDLPPITDKVNILPGSEAESLTIRSGRWILNTKYQWIYVANPTSSGGGGGDGIADIPEYPLSTDYNRSIDAYGNIAWAVDKGGIPEVPSSPASTNYTRSTDSSGNAAWVIDDAGLPEVPSTPHSTNYTRSVDSTGNIIWKVEGEVIPDISSTPHSTNYTRSTDANGNISWAAEEPSVPDISATPHSTDYTRSTDSSGNITWKAAEAAITDIPSAPVSTSYNRSTDSNGNPVWTRALTDVPFSPYSTKYSRGIDSIGNAKWIIAEDGLPEIPTSPVSTSYNRSTDANGNVQWTVDGGFPEIPVDPIFTGYNRNVDKDGNIGWAPDYSPYYTDVIGYRIVNNDTVTIWSKNYDYADRTAVYILDENLNIVDNPQWDVNNLTIDYSLAHDNNIGKSMLLTREQGMPIGTQFQDLDRSLMVRFEEFPVAGGAAIDQMTQSEWDALAEKPDLAVITNSQFDIGV